MTPNVVQAEVSALADIILAGQAPGTTVPGFCNPDDSAPLNSPVPLGLLLTPGQVVQFTTVTGTVNTSGGIPQVQPDGATTANASFSAREFGLSQIVGPPGALVGVFLDDGIPSTATPRPTDLDFRGAGARDEPMLSPALRQPFYIGRGKTSGGTLKSFVTPPNATRLFIGVLDGGGCNADNTGAFDVEAVAN